MPLNSPAFLFIFLPLFMGAYHVVPRRFRLVIGILGSAAFYAWGQGWRLIIVLAITLATYGLARGIDRWRDGPASRILLWTGLGANVALLLGLRQIPGAGYPLGLSYVTFQAMAHLLDVYRQPDPSTASLLKFSFFLLLFPKIPAGPIARYRVMVDQFESLTPTADGTADGLRRFIRGLAKKVLIADVLARMVDPIFQLPSPAIPASWAWLVIVSYALQLYFDFSGYTDMAIGLGRMLGVTFPENFNLPYISRSVSDFWRRWHISLSTWFRDYVFYPLERRRIPVIGQQLNILIVFALVGIWHGQTWTFLAWGILHGLALAFESTSLGRKLVALPRPVGNIYALFIIMLGWVFFRSPSIVFALEFVKRLLGRGADVQPLPFGLTSPLPILEPTIMVALVAGLVLSLPVSRWWQVLEGRVMEARPALRVPRRLVLDGALCVLLVLSIAAMASFSFAPGIYARF